MNDLYTRRIGNELNLLHALAERNPGRIANVTADSGTFMLALHGPAATLYGVVPPCPIARHDLRIAFPVHFPAVPMELFLARPVVHPNVHPETGFVCLWDRHRVSHTVEHALHKLVAMLAGQLSNSDVRHVMQPDALDAHTDSSAMPLAGVLHDDLPLLPAPAFRRRLQ